MAFGGIAARAALLAVCDRDAVDRALRSGQILADARGRYALPATDEAVRLAHALSGVLCLTSAALHHGWEVLNAPERPHVLVPKKRKIAPDRRTGVELHRGDLHPDDIAGIATSVEMTLTQCLRHLPYVDALAVADSALRHGATPATLTRVARSARGPGSPQVRRVAAAARAEAANPFESGLRGISHSVPGLNCEPQRVLSSARQTARPDLVDLDLGVALEADSFEWHGSRAALAADARRYNLLVIDGWIVLRFAWEDVMFDQEYVRSVLVGVVALVTGRTKVARHPRRAA